MSSRCLNKIMLIGNLTRDPELRYTPNGVAVCSFGVATNRSWTTTDGQKKDDAQFHKIVAWNQLAEVCAKVLVKGRRVFVEGRIQYREWTGTDNLKRQVAEVVIEDMIILDSRRVGEGGEESLSEVSIATEETVIPTVDDSPQEEETVETKVEKNDIKEEKEDSGDIPF